MTILGLVEKAKEHKTKIILGALGVASAAIAVVLLNTKPAPEEPVLEGCTYLEETEMDDIEDDSEDPTEE